MYRFWNEVVFPALENIVQDVVGILPELAGALTILIIGWVIARVFGKLVGKLLGKVGFDSIAERAGISGFLAKSGYKQEVSSLIGKLVYWTIMLMFLLSAAEALQLHALAETLQKVVAYIPNLIVIVMVVVFGALLAKLAGKLTTGAAASANIDFAELLGNLVTNFILVAVFVIAISQLEIQSAVLDYAFIALLGAVALAVAITLGLGTRDVAQGIIYGIYARKIFEVGQQVSIGEQEGELLQVGTINSVIKTPQEIISMPNKALIEGTVRIKRESNPS